MAAHDAATEHIGSFDPSIENRDVPPLYTRVADTRAVEPPPDGWAQTLHRPDNVKFDYRTAEITPRDPATNSDDIVSSISVQISRIDDTRVARLSRELLLKISDAMLGTYNCATGKKRLAIRSIPDRDANINLGHMDTVELVNPSWHVSLPIDLLDSIDRIAFVKADYPATSLFWRFNGAYFPFSHELRKYNPRVNPDIVSVSITRQQNENHTFKDFYTLKREYFNHALNLKRIDLEGVPVESCPLIIGLDAFKDCRSLEHVRLGSAVTSIETGAFENTHIKRIHIPPSVRCIKSGAFHNTRLQKKWCKFFEGAKIQLVEAGQAKPSSDPHTVVVESGAFDFDFDLDQIHPSVDVDDQTKVKHAAPELATPESQLGRRVYHQHDVQAEYWIERILSPDQSRRTRTRLGVRTPAWRLTAHNRPLVVGVPDVVESIAVKLSRTDPSKIQLLKFQPFWEDFFLGLPGTYNRRTFDQTFLHELGADAPLADAVTILRQKLDVHVYVPVDMLFQEEYDLDADKRYQTAYELSFAQMASLTITAPQNRHPGLLGRANNYLASVSLFVVPKKITLSSRDFMHAQNLRRVDLSRIPAEWDVTIGRGFSVGGRSGKPSLLKDVVLGNVVTSIERAAFQHTSIERIHIPRSVRCIKWAAFNQTKLGLKGCTFFPGAKIQMVAVGQATPSSDPRTVVVESGAFDDLNQLSVSVDADDGTVMQRFRDAVNAIDLANLRGL